MKAQKRAIFVVLLFIAALAMFFEGMSLGQAMRSREFDRAVDDLRDELFRAQTKIQHDIDDLRWGITDNLMGVASWYGPGFDGRTMANGEDYNMFAMTAAHRELPLGSEIRIENLLNNKVALARITDRGPYVFGRMLDVSKGVAEKLGMVDLGIVPVRVRILPVTFKSPRISDKD